MRHIGHTMATPDLEIRDAVDLFYELGMDGVEVVSRSLEECGDKHGEAAGEARIFSYDWGDSEIASVLAYADNKGLPFVTLTQYQKAINSSDKSEREMVIEHVLRHMAFACRIGADYVRVYGGADGFGEASRSNLVESLEILASSASEMGLILLLENHPGTLTVNGQQTVEIVKAVGADSLGILYDPANILCHSDEDWETSYRIQEELIKYVHVKDFQIKDGKRVACPVGDGIVPWREILGCLKRSGYTGNLSYEYEKKWNPEQLPESRIGLAKSLGFVRDCLS